MIEVWLQTMPPALIYLLVGLVIGLESMGVPLPGELTLMSAALMAARGITNPFAVACAASFGAIVGDSIGYAIGRRGGRAMLERLGRRFPKHFGPAHLARAEGAFRRWGTWAVFFGRFIALLRILAGPLAGALRVPYHRFLTANASGGIVWGFGTTFAVYYAGRAAERWLKSFAWVALLIAVVFGLATTLYLRRRAARHGETEAAAPSGDAGAVEETPAHDAGGEATAGDARHEVQAADGSDGPPAFGDVDDLVAADAAAELDEAETLAELEALDAVAGADRIDAVADQH